MTFSGVVFLRDKLLDSFEDVVEMERGSRGNGLEWGLVMAVNLFREAPSHFCFLPVHGALRV